MTEDRPDRLGGDGPRRAADDESFRTAGAPATATPAVPVDSSDHLLAAGDVGGKVIRGSSLRALASLAGLFAGALTAPLVIRYLGSTEFGRLAVVQSLVTIVTALIEGGLANVAIRRYALADAAGRDRLIRNLLGLRIVTVALGAVIAMGYALLAGFDRTLVAGTGIAMLGLALNSYQNALVTPLNADLRLGASAAVDLVRSTTASVVQVTLVLVGASLLPFYATVGIASITALALTLRLTRRDVRPLPLADREVWGALLRETGVYALATALGAMYFQIALQATKLVSTDAAVGDYSVAFRVVEIGNTLPWLIAGSVFPVLSHAAEFDRVRLRYVLGRSLDSALLIGTGIALGVGVGAVVAIDIVGGSEAGGSVDVLRLLALAIPATYLIAVGSFALLALRATWAILACNVIAVAIAVGASALMIKPLGAEGAALTTVAVEWALGIAYLVALLRIDGGLRPTPSALARLGLVLALAVGATLGTTAAGLPAFPTLVVAMAVFAAGVAVAGLAPPEVALAVRERVGRTSGSNREVP